MKWLVLALVLSGCKKRAYSFPDTDAKGEGKPAFVALDSMDLIGTVPQRFIEAPGLFVAKNSDGSPRGPEDLKGRATVLWFFPAAATGG